MRTNYVLIDYENVQPGALAVLEKDYIKVIVFVGAKQSSVAFDMAASLQCLGPNARYIKISGNGPNSLDFHIAYYIGQIAASEPDAFFHIISKDTGFDPLIAHLKTKKVHVRRARDVSAILSAKASNSKKPASSKSASEKLAVIVANLKPRGDSKPRTVKTLSNTINSLFRKSLSEKEISSLIQLMKTQGLITVSETKVAYSLRE